MTSLITVLIASICMVVAFFIGKREGADLEQNRVLLIIDKHRNQTGKLSPSVQAIQWAIESGKPVAELEFAKTEEP